MKSNAITVNNILYGAKVVTAMAAVVLTAATLRFFIYAPEYAWQIVDKIVG